MKRLRTFFRRHVLWVVFFAVAIPLASILALQYRSLSKLEKTSTVAEKVWMKNYLGDVTKEVKYYYRTTAEQVLNVPAAAITGERLRNSRHLFGKCEAKGAKSLFIVSFASPGESEIFFYKPSGRGKIIEPPLAELRAANVAAAPLKMLSEERTPVQTTTVTTDERDLENRIIMKPITDDSSQVVGVAGMIIDNRYFREHYLPRAIQNSLPKFFPDDAQDNVIVTVHDGAGQLVLATQPVKGQDNETWMPVPYFQDWRIAIRSRDMTPEQWAHWNFNFNLALSVALTVVLLGGIALALRTVSHELRLSQMKTDFVSNVSHELRTPLSSIRVFGEFLKLGRVAGPEKVREYGEYVETESRRLTQLIDNILDFSKIESDRKTYQFERADVAEVVGATLKTFDVQLKQHGFGVDLRLPPGRLPMAVIDSESIAQALMNLLDNAVKYSGESKEITVRLGHRAGFITIAVTDRGIGIAREEQGKIFEKFYRVGTGLVHDVKGSGLGLALVEHIVKAHRGRVTVESEGSGRGSTFTIHLPATEGLGGHAETPQSAPILSGDSTFGFDLKR